MLIETKIKLMIRNEIHIYTIINIYAIINGNKITDNDILKIMKMYKFSSSKQSFFII